MIDLKDKVAQLENKEQRLLAEIDSHKKDVEYLKEELNNRVLVEQKLWGENQFVNDELLVSREKEQDLELMITELNVLGLEFQDKGERMV